MDLKWFPHAGPPTLPQRDTGQSVQTAEMLVTKSFKCSIGPVISYGLYEHQLMRSIVVPVLSRLRVSKWISYA
jgi:hypothetical protein